MRIRKPWYRNPRKRLVFPILFIPWLIGLIIWCFFEAFGKVADFIELFIGSPLTNIVTWTENYDYDMWRKTHPDHDIVRIGHYGPRYDLGFDPIWPES